MDYEKAQWIAEQLGQADIDAWHRGEMTDHVEELMAQAGIEEMQVWGGGSNGTEPLSVIVH